MVTFACDLHASVLSGCMEGMTLLAGIICPDLHQVLIGWYRMSLLKAARQATFSKSLKGNFDQLLLQDQLAQN
jgi:hypothetical protein